MRTLVAIAVLVAAIAAAAAQPLDERVRRLEREQALQQVEQDLRDRAAGQRRAADELLRRDPPDLPPSYDKPPPLLPREMFLPR